MSRRLRTALTTLALTAATLTVLPAATDSTMARYTPTPREPSAPPATPRHLPQVGGGPEELPGPGDRTLVPVDRQGRPERQLDRDVLLQHVHLRALARRPKYDFHGLGAFLIMNEQLRRTDESDGSTVTNN